jgi:hypothetical protein
LDFGEQGGGGFVGGVLGDEFAFEGFVEEGGGEFVDLGAGGLITGFEAIMILASSYQLILGSCCYHDATMQGK